MPNFIIQESDNLRLDQVLINQYPEYSRNFFQKFISTVGITVNNRLIKKSSYSVKVGDKIEFDIPENIKKNPDSDLGVNILLDHPDFFIIYKPAGLITHSDVSTQQNITLVDWLLHKFQYLSQVGPENQRAIVHRLDKDTSGLLIIPKDNSTHEYFLNLFKNRQIKKTYLAIVEGNLNSEGVIDYPISRHPHLPYKMTHTINSGREAVTKYKPISYSTELNISLIEAKPLTGRTHQIRVHLSAIGFPILGDIIYNKPSKLISRHALHAYKLQFWYKDQYFCIWHEMPMDMSQINFPY